MKRALLLLAVCVPAMAAQDFKLVGENQTFSFKIDVKSVKIVPRESSRDISATVRLNFHSPKFDKILNNFISQEDYELVAKCDDHKVFVKNVSFYSADKNLISIEPVNGQLDVPKEYFEDDLTVANKFYNVSCEVKKTIRKKKFLI